VLDVQAGGCGPETADLRQVLMSVFADTLGRTVRADDDFFECGGTSLLAMTLALEIETAVGRELPISIVHEAPSVEALVARLREDLPAAPSMIVTLRPGPPGPALFIVAGIGGAAMELRDVASRIGADLAVFGIEAPALHGHPVQHRIEDIAAISVAAMLAVQPQGPYLIAGYSFGGLVAFAMARILTEAGREVRFLSLIDTYPDAGFAPRAIAARLAQLAATPPAQLAAELGGTSRRIAMRLRGRGQPPGAGPSAGFAAMPDRLAQVVEAGRAAQVAYRPRRLALDLHFIRPITPMRGAPHDPRTRWRRLVRRMEVEIVAGDHLSMIRPGAEVAAILGRRLRQVLA